MKNTNFKAVESGMRRPHLWMVYNTQTRDYHGENGKMQMDKETAERLAERLNQEEMK